jgi:cytochrome c
VKCLRFLLILDSLLLLTGQAAAQQIGDADQGLDMASKVCSECHAFELGQPLSPQPDAPRFEDIAYSGLTTNMLVVLLRSSHPTMPNIMLSDTDIANLVEYIRSLKRK